MSIYTMWDLNNPNNVSVIDAADADKAALKWMDIHWHEYEPDAKTDGGLRLAFVDDAGLCSTVWIQWMMVPRFSATKDDVGAYFTDVLTKQPHTPIIRWGDKAFTVHKLKGGVWQLVPPHDPSHAYDAATSIYPSYIEVLYTIAKWVERRMYPDDVPF